MATALRPIRLGLLDILLVLLLGALVMQFCVRNLGDSVPSSQTKVAQIYIFQLKGALELFRLEAGRYPNTQEGLAALIRNPGTIEDWHGPYLATKEIPADPWGHPYIYRSPGKYGYYDLLTYGRDGREGGRGEDQDIMITNR